MGANKQYLKPRVIEMYNDGVLFDKIAEELDVSMTFVKRMINKMIADGELVKRKKKYPGRVVEKKVKKCVSRPDYPELEDGVNCTKEISAQCIFGVGRTSTASYLCNYCDIMKHSRGGDPRCCTKFQKITEDNPRRYSEFDNGYHNYNGWNAKD